MDSNRTIHGPGWRLIAAPVAKAFNPNMIEACDPESSDHHILDSSATLGMDVEFSTVVLDGDY